MGAVGVVGPMSQAACASTTLLGSLSLGREGEGTMTTTTNMSSILTAETETGTQLDPGIFGPAGAAWLVLVSALRIEAEAGLAV